MRRSFAFKCTLLVIAWLLLAIACVQIPSRVFWPASFGALTLPVALGLNVAAVGYWLLRNWRVAALPALVAVLTWPHFQRGLALHPARLASMRSAPKPTDQTVRLVSANVRIFNVYPQLREKDPRAPAQFIKWLADNPADVLCLQEFYNEPAGGRSSEGRLFRSVDQIGKQAGRQAFVSKTLTNAAGAEFGMAIFSRFPIVGRGTIPFDRLTQNHAMYADLRLPSGDTIRVYNFHLQSMSMDEKDIVDSYSSKDGLKKKGLGLMRRFKRGLVARSVQVDTLIQRFERCRYPMLLCADLNDLPYSYSYDQLADHFQNAWATVGNGVGATYNGALPFVRIDNQFASPQWQVEEFGVNYDIPYSDHFPTSATYRLLVPTAQQ
ncbi:endonuclease/exonuclease/phosphatase family protein [Hymenobacter cellulosilyticus]|uniref:Endonuclease/exonuclease/phosphatase family protein n=1 Tax=Hymenobacter cellulosilyticus TaxID=2932248 RepID=A0A8T9Q886_9BACT|nr:endonuclease/exonuclease/phosphatase family protein [Hymenobacter cellulosilyticus]UOQ72621.1 endonuclease/exonuclease/phosphatase family protein [Hymenobacter cellulosilyticus]